MKKRVKIFIFFSLLALCLSACSKSKTPSILSIHFIDVGPYSGDSALIKCDNHYMLIDGGDYSAGEKVYRVLEEEGVQHLDILAISHLHEDHYGGLTKALTYASSAGITICNSDYSNKPSFQKLERQLNTNKSQIVIPKIGDIYTLGDAKVEVIDVSSTAPNDSLVLLITHGEKRFLFTGDIEASAQRRLVSKYENDTNTPYKIDLLKMPHHGGEAIIRFIDIFDPSYAVISVGAKDNDHPYQVTLDRLSQDDAIVYRTDKDGDIFVTSDGKSLSIKTSK